MTGSTHESGQVAYEAYGDAVKWTAYDGKKIAPWADQDEYRRAAWSAAADAVTRHVKIATAACLIGSTGPGYVGEALEAVGEALLRSAAAKLGVAPAQLDDEARGLPRAGTSGGHLIGSAPCCEGVTPEDVATPYEAVADADGRPDHQGEPHPPPSDAPAPTASGLPVLNDDECKAGTPGCCADEA